ncbi:MAG: hypothetical protein ABI175_30380 [Polyangiales bacterium]
MFARVVVLTLGWLGGLSSCARWSGRGQKEATIVPDPVVDAAPREDAARPDVDLVLADARLVDVRKMTLSCALSPELPVREATDGRTALVLGKDSVLRAFDVGCSGELWHATAPACDELLIGGGRVFCPTHSSITWWPLVTKSPRGSDVSADGKLVPLRASTPIAQALVIEKRLMVFHESSVLDVYEADTLMPFYSVRLPIPPWGGKTFVTTTKPAGACGVSPTGKDFYLLCVDALGATRIGRTVTIAKPTDPPFTNFYIRSNDGRHLLLSSMWGSGPRRAVVVRLSDGAEVARVEDEIAAVVTRVEDGTIEGLLATTPKLRLLETNGATRWTDGALSHVDDSAVATAKGNRIYVVNYPRISNGAMPFAFDRLTGKLLWTGDFEPQSVGHSAYANEIGISLRTTDDGEVLSVRGSESMVTYLQLFDVRDGKRRYSQTRLTF